MKVRLFRYCLIFCLVILAIYISLLTIDGRVKAETNSELDLEIIFSKTLNSVGKEYLTSKFEIIKMEEAALPFLRKMEKSNAIKI